MHGVTAGCGTPRSATGTTRPTSASPSSTSRYGAGNAASWYYLRSQPWTTIPADPPLTPFKFPCRYPVSRSLSYLSGCCCSQMSKSGARTNVMLGSRPCDTSVGKALCPAIADQQLYPLQVKEGGVPPPHLTMMVAHGDSTDHHSRLMCSSPAAGGGAGPLHGPVVQVHRGVGQPVQRGLLQPHGRRDHLLPREGPWQHRPLDWLIRRWCQLHRHQQQQGWHLDMYQGLSWLRDCCRLAVVVGLLVCVCRTWT